MGTPLFLRLPMVPNGTLDAFGETNPDRVFFTSDLHFGHGGKTGTEGILKYCKRPWKHVDEMDEALIFLWNRVVEFDDLVFILGDVSFHPRKVIRDLIPRLHGKKYLIAGNHDHKDNCPASLFMNRYKAVRLQTVRHDIYLSHMFEDDYARNQMQLPKTGREIYLHGHSHGSVGDLPNRVDVGVDCWDYKPVSLTDILDYVSGMASGRCIPRRPSGIERRGDA